METRARADIDKFDEEQAEAARDLLRLFGKAKRFIGLARTMRQRGADPRPVLAEIRRRVSETIVDDCLIFDEPTVLAIFDFASTWREAAYEIDADRVVEADAAFERSYLQVAKLLSETVGFESGAALPVSDTRLGLMH